MSDLYTLLMTYASKNNTPYISIDKFVNFLKINLERQSTNANSPISEWAGDTQQKVLTGLTKLVSEKKCSIQATTAGQRVYMPSFLIERIAQAYITMNDSGELPFPDAKTLKITIPENQIRAISVESGLINYLNDPQKTVFPVLKLVFPKNFGEMIVLPEYLPLRLMEMSLLKIKDTIRRNNGLDFYKQKLFSHFVGQEPHVREYVTTLMSKTIDCVDELQKASEFSFSLWLFLCPLIKTQVMDNINRNSEITNLDLAMYQAAELLLIFNNHYKILAINQHEKDLTFAAIYEKLATSPYMYSLSEIMQFTNKQGASILTVINEKELNNYLTKKMTANNSEDLPELLKFKTGEDFEWFVLKSKVWPLFNYLINQVSPRVRENIIERWTNMLREFRKECSMDKESDFEELVHRNTRLFSPPLFALLHDKKTCLLQYEIEKEKGTLAANERFFDFDKPRPIKIIMGLKKEEILTFCRFSLPFWYSLPLLVVVIRSMKNLFGKKSKSGKNKNDLGQDAGGNAFKATADKIIAEIVPDGSSLDSYIDSIMDRWNQLLNKSAREKLAGDVNAIVRDHIRHMLKIQTKSSFNQIMISDTAETIINMNQALRKINNRDGLRLYIKLFITKILMNEK